MPTVTETAWSEVLARVKAAPTFGVALDNIRRAHRTVVTKENCPAVHLIEGTQKLNEDKTCDFRWQMDGTLAVFVRSDLGLEAARPYITAIVERINPEAAAPAVPYSNGVRLELLQIVPETEIADEDATRVNIEFRFKFSTERWTVG